MKKMPQRTCIGCNVKKDKKDLIRIVKNKKKEINIDKTGKQDGRGAYICNNEECLKGDSVAYVSYDIMANPYSTTMAQKKTEADAAKIIANDIALRLGAYFHSQMKEKGPNHAF